jgi:hypothetical protein
MHCRLTIEQCFDWSFSMSPDPLLRVLLSAALVCVASPAVSQITSLPFGQRNTILTPMPFGQRSNSPLRPLAKRAGSAALTGGTVVGQWNMDETTGTIMNDSSGNGNNGKLTDVLTTGSGYVFGGLTSKVVVPNSASLTLGSKDFSYTVQFQTDRIPPQGTDYDLIRKGTGTSTGGEFKLEIVYDRGIGKPKCVVWDSMGHSASERGNVNVADGQLHTVTCTKTSTSLTLQVDSSTPTKASTSIPGPISNIRPLTLGVKAPTATGVAADWYFGTIRSASVSVVP